MNNSGKKQYRIKKVFSGISDMGKNALCTDFIIHTVGSDELVLECYIGIIEYSNECVKIKTNTKTVIISGKNLELANMIDEVVCVTGKIESIVFEQQSR